MAGTTGLEPATSDVTGRRSNQLSYVPASLLLTLAMLTQRYWFMHVDAKHSNAGSIRAGRLYILNSHFSQL